MDVFIHRLGPREESSQAYENLQAITLNPEPGVRCLACPRETRPVACLGYGTFPKSARGTSRFRGLGV